MRLVSRTRKWGTEHRHQQANDRPSRWLWGDSLIVVSTTHGGGIEPANPCTRHLPGSPVQPGDVVRQSIPGPSFTTPDARLAEHTPLQGSRPGAPSSSLESRPGLVPRPECRQPSPRQWRAAAPSRVLLVSCMSVIGSIRVESWPVQPRTHATGKGDAGRRRDRHCRYTDQTLADGLRNG